MQERTCKNAHWARALHNRGTLPVIVDLYGMKRDMADSLLEGTDMSGKLSAEELLKVLVESWRDI